MAKRGWQGRILKLLRSRDYRLEVVGTEPAGEHMHRVRLRSEAVMRDMRPRGGEYLRCWFPTIDDPRYDQTRDYQRGYTITEVDPETHEFSFYFLLHEPAGPASTWAKHAKIGDELAVTHYGARTFTPPEPAPVGYLFITDVAGLPYAMETIAQVPQGAPVKLWMTKYHDADMSVPLLPTDPRVEITWLEPGADPILEGLQAMDLTGWAVHVTAEVAITLAVRKHALKVAELPKTHVHAHGYWVEGRPIG